MNQDLGYRRVLTQLNFQTKFPSSFITTKISCIIREICQVDNVGKIQFCEYF